MFNNLPRFLGGLANSLFFGSRHMDIIIEPERIGYLFRDKREWVPRKEVMRVEQFADVWVISSAGSVIDIPVSLIDEDYMAHVQAMSQEGKRSTSVNE